MSKHILYPVYMDKNDLDHNLVLNLNREILSRVNTQECDLDNLNSDIMLIVMSGPSNND